MGEWHEVKGYSPCIGCQMGWADVSYGQYYAKYDDCTETCEKYKDWLREGYATIAK